MKNLYIAVIVTYCMFVAVHARGGDELTPYLEGSNHTITEREYGDLKAYVERAKKILIQTLDDSTAFSGTELREHLLGGIESALSSTDLRGELLLFRYVLTRALDIDRIYFSRNSGTNLVELSQLSAQVVLLPAIVSAIDYYQTSDMPRLATTVVPSPNWTEFAADQVSHFLRMVDLAPSKQQAILVAKTSLGWTARSLNSALERRNPEVADHIVRLGELYNSPGKKNQTYISRAQEALLAVYRSYRKELHVIALAPASSGSDLKINDSPFILWRLIKGGGRLVGSGVTGTGRLAKRVFGLPILGVNIGGATPIGMDQSGSGTDEFGQPYKGPYVFKHVSLVRFSAFAGGGRGAIYGGTADGASRFHNAGIVNLRFAGIFGKKLSSEDGEKAFFGTYNEMSGVLTAPDESGKFLGNGKIILSGHSFFVLAAAFHYERNAYGSFEEQLVRFGWAPQVMLRVGHRQYVVLQGFLGGGSLDCTAQDRKHCAAPDSSGDEGGLKSTSFVGGLLAVAQLKRFSASAEFSYTPAGFEYSSESADRTALDATVAIPLGVLVGNDSLILSGQAIKHGSGVSGSSGYVFYGLTW
jgi:hypothetical protein